MPKSQILQYLARVSEASAADVAADFGVSLPAAGMILLRLARSGLVERVLDPQRRCLFYALTPKGLARLEFFERRRC